MIPGLVHILLWQGAGEPVSHFLLPHIPGPVIGLVLLLGFLAWRDHVPDSMALVSDAFSQHLGLLFVPAATGVILFLPQLRQHAWAVILTLTAYQIGFVLYTRSQRNPLVNPVGIAERMGYSPTLTAVFAVITGILGAILARFVLDGLGLKIWWQRGFAIGVAAHGIGTSRAFGVHPEAGTYASLAMGLHGILGAVAIPMLAGYIPHLLNFSL